MGTYQLEDFRDELRGALGGIGTNSPHVTEARLDRWINATYLQVAMPNIYRHMGLETTVEITLATDDVDYSISTPSSDTFAGLYEVYTVVFYDTAGTIASGDRRRKLDPTTYREILDRNQHVSGEPTAWARWGNTLYLDRRPSSSENGKKAVVYGYARPRALNTSTNSIAQLHPEWDEIIVAGAAFRGWMWLGQGSKAEEFREDYGRLIDEVGDMHDTDDWRNRIWIEGHDQTMRERP